MFRRTFINSFLKCLLALTLFTPLHGMEYATKNDLVLYKKLINKSYVDLKTYCGVSNNLDNIIDVAEKSGNGHLMASLINICLPPEVVQNYIAPHLSAQLATKYNHTLLYYKLLTNFFKPEAVDCSGQWDFLRRHDGSYWVVPRTGINYSMWDAINTNLRETRVYNDEQYINFLRSKEGKELSFLWADNLHGRRKKMLFTNEGKSRKMVTFRNSVSRLIFSNDSTLLAVGYSETNGLLIYDTETFTGKAGYLQGSVSALCAAHHTPAFVAGANKSFLSSELSNLVLIHQGKNTCLSGHDEDLIISVEFSLDDTRLLTLSEVSNGYHLKLWDTSDFNAIKCIYDVQGTGVQVQKAFFICDGQRIVMVGKDGIFSLFDGLTGNDVGNYFSRRNRFFDHGQQSNKVPIFIWSNKNKLLISSFDKIITIHSPEKDKHIGRIVCGTTPIGIGLTADENSIIFMDKDNKAYRFPLYEDQELRSVYFIENQATLLQLYDMLNMSKKHKKSNKERVASKTKDFILAMQSYIQARNITSEK